jgi:shikimate kinase
VSSSQKVILIGLPGSGKTTLAKQVAELLEIHFFDLDDEIEKSSGLKVGDIFKSGETEFRKIESETLIKIIHYEFNFILATGGGAPCFNNNLDLMKKSGTVIFLDVPVDEIVNRISQQSIHRPLLTGDVKERINALREQRINTYKQAQFSLFGANIQSSEIIRLIQ